MSRSLILAAALLAVTFTAEAASAADTVAAAQQGTTVTRANKTPLKTVDKQLTRKPGTPVAAPVVTKPVIVAKPTIVTKPVIVLPVVQRYHDHHRFDRYRFDAAHRVYAPYVYAPTYVKPAPTVVDYKTVYVKPAPAHAAPVYRYFPISTYTSDTAPKWCAPTTVKDVADGLIKQVWRCEMTEAAAAPLVKVEPVAVAAVAPIESEVPPPVK